MKIKVLEMAKNRRDGRRKMGKIIILKSFPLKFSSLEYFNNISHQLSISRKRHCGDSEA